MYKYCLFDLDGTLTDPKEGICKSAQYGLHKMGIEEPDIDKLEPFIGPPLVDSFMEFYGMSREDADKAVAFYRERFSAVGLYENEVYKGIEDMLDALKDRGARLAVASSKPTVYVEKILEHFKLSDYFDAVIGSNLDGTRSAKSEVVEEALLCLYYGKEHEGKTLSGCQDKYEMTAMIGDRKFDIEGAHAMGIAGIGVDYGYAAKGELKAAGADRIAKTVPELEAILLGESVKGYKQKNTVDIKKKPDLGEPVHKEGFLMERNQEWMPKTSLQKSLYVLTPFMLYYMVNTAATLMGKIVIEKAMESGNGPLGRAIASHSWIGSGGISVMSLLVVILVMVCIYHKTDKMNLEVDINMLVAAVSGLVLSLGLNLFTGYLCTWIPSLRNLMSESSYNKDMPLLVLFVFFGVISPIAEELCFRYLLYGRMKRIYGKIAALIFSSLFFGIYHGHILQGIYAVIMGMCMAMVYEWSGSLLAPIAFHMFANIAVVTSPYLPDEAQKVIGSLPVTFLWIIFGVGTMIAHKKYQLFKNSIINDNKTVDKN